ncbi:MAG: 23S rRNA (cytidine(2498)-2'-O)-methyltransferase RlmM [Gallionella sp.]
MSRLLSLNHATAPEITPTTKTHRRNIDPTHLNHWLLYCRAGFENECAQEVIGQARRQRPVLAEQPEIITQSGYAVIALNAQSPAYQNLIFSRQLIRVHHIIDVLSERDRLTPLLAAITTLPGNFGVLWLEVPDTNEGKALSAFIRRFQPLLESALREQGRLAPPPNQEGNASQPTHNALRRLHIFFPNKSSAFIGSTDPDNSAASIMGIMRLSMPREAPSRSTLKIAEAIDVFLDKSEQMRWLHTGMTAVDLGAAPGGWTWQMVKRGIRVTAVDNGDMKDVLAKHPMVEHLRQDGFKFVPRRKVDWLICDMVEKPAKVAELIAHWFTAGWCKHALFNLKLPMKQRTQALDSALNGIRSRLTMEGISYKMTAKQLYHDREEVTVFLSKTKNR